MKILTAIVATVAVLTGSSAAAQPAKPTILLVHGAFADASSWNGVIAILRKDGYDVVAVANPLRGVKNDARYVDDIANSIKQPIVLVGHSYGGSVITEVQATNVKALVYVAAFAPDVGESAATLSGKFPGSTLGAALAPPVTLADGGKDLYIQQRRFHDQFAADISAAAAAAMAVGQRPITEAALNETTVATAWKTIPSWFVYGDGDKNIPPQALQFMADRAKSKHTEVVRGGSHVVMTSNPKAVAKVIERAAVTSPSLSSAGGPGFYPQ